MGFESEAHRIQELFFEGKRDEAIPLVPTEFADEISLVGSKERIRDRLAGVGSEPGHDDRDQRRPRHAAQRCRSSSARSRVRRSAPALRDRHDRRHDRRRIAARPARRPSTACEKSSNAVTTRSRSSGDMRRTTESISRRRLSITSSTSPWPGARELDHDLAAVDGRRLAHDEPAGDEPIAHARHRRRVHVEPLGERADGLRALEREHHQGAELRQRDLVADRSERAHGDAHERATGADDRVDDGIG